jgi:hypothetical protein
MVDEIGTEARPEVLLGQGHADTRPEALSQGPGRGLDPQVVIDLGMTGRVESPLSEVLQIFHLHGEATEVEQGVEKHRPVPVGEDEPVSIRPIGPARVDLQIPAPQSDGDIRHPHRHSGVARVGGLDGVHGQSLDGVDGELLDRCVRHRRRGYRFQPSGRQT